MLFLKIFLFSSFKGQPRDQQGGVAADLVCLLEEGTPRNVAQLKAEIESYFVLGAARIDMIAKVMDLDNSIGGHNFDIPLLHQTEMAIAEFSQPEGMRLKMINF